MCETTLQYYFKRGLFGSQVLWVKKRIQTRDVDQLGYAGPSLDYTVDRKATASEAAHALPVMNASLPR